MKKILILLLLNLSIPIVCFSQTTSNYPKILNDSLIVITPYQLKLTNLIFLEHSKLKEINPLLEKKILTLESVNKSLEQIDSIRQQTISEYEIVTERNQETISNLNSTLISKENKISKLKKFTICGFGISAALIIILAIK